MSTTNELKDLFGSGGLFGGAVLINLDSRPERLERSMAELERFGLDGCVTRMSAHEHENGMFGCSVSHLEVVRLARREGWKSDLILEDDIKISAGFAEHASRACADLAEQQWGLFQLGAMNPNVVEFVTPRLFRFIYGQGGHALALHERTYDFPIDEYICQPDRGNLDKRVHCPFDEYVNNQLTHEFEAYASSRLLISQHSGHSDTWKYEVDYQRMIEDAFAKLRVPPTLVSFAGGSAVVDWSLPAEGERVQFLFGASCGHAPEATSPDFRIGPDASGQPALWRGAELVFSSIHGSERDLRLIQDVRKQLSGASRGGILLRAGALTVGSRSVLLPGPFGAGKTTLMATLMSECDAGYLTDELAFVAEGERQVMGLDGALGVNRSSELMLVERIGFEPEADGVVHGLDRYLVDPEVFGRRASDQRAELGLILFPARCAGRSPELRRLSEAEAAMRLMGVLVNGPNLPGHGFAEIARLARSSPAFDLRCSEFAQLAPRLRALLGEIAASSSPSLSPR